MRDARRRGSASTDALEAGVADGAVDLAQIDPRRIGIEACRQDRAGRFAPMAGSSPPASRSTATGSTWTSSTLPAKTRIGKASSLPLSFVSPPAAWRVMSTVGERNGPPWCRRARTARWWRPGTAAAGQTPATAGPGWERRTSKLSRLVPGLCANGSMTPASRAGSPGHVADAGLAHIQHAVAQRRVDDDGLERCAVVGQTPHPRLDLGVQGGQRIEPALSCRRRTRSWWVDRRSRPRRCPPAHRRPSDRGAGRRQIGVHVDRVDHHVCVDGRPLGHDHRDPPGDARRVETNVHVAQPHDLRPGRQSCS